MDLAELRDNLNVQLDKQLISSRTLLHGFRMIDEASRKTGAYVDPRYIPFYYYLGKNVSPKSLVEVGFRLGLFSGCFFKSCHSVERFLAFQEAKADEFYSARLGVKNVKDNYKGQFDIHIGHLSDDGFNNLFRSQNWDLGIVNEEVGYDQHRIYLDVLWSQLNDDGLIVMDYISSNDRAKKAFLDFCQIKNREPVIFATRYGTGMVQK